MDSVTFETEPSHPAAPTAVKILVAGGFGSGKTTLVGTASEISPLRAEEVVTDPGTGFDGASDVTAREITVSMDFGRLTLGDGLILYLLGTPEDGFWPLWDELAAGALGAVVLTDTRHLDDCLPSIGYFERCGTPFAVAVNCFGGTRRHQPEVVRRALGLDPRIPLLLCDARDRGSVMAVLVTLVEHVLATVSATNAN